MKMIKRLPIIAFALGMPVAYAQVAHGGIVSPFGATPATSATKAPAAPAAPAAPGATAVSTAPAGAALPSMSLAQAKAALTPAAARKIQPALLDAVLRGAQRDVIVMFQDQSGAAGVTQQAQRLSVEKNAYSTTRRSVHAALGAANVVFLREYEHLPVAFVRVQSNAALLDLLNHPQVASVVENVSVPPHTTESLPLIHQPQAIATGRRGTGTAVAVLDSGANIGLAQFGSCSSANSSPSCRVVATFDTTGEGFPTSGIQVEHGTMVAGIVAKVAPGAKLALVNVRRKGTGGSEVSDMLAGINWAIQNQALHNIVALNISSGLPDIDAANPRCTAGPGTLHDLMNAAFNAARRANILPVVSAGNHQATNAGIRSFPACAASNENAAQFEAAAVVGALYDSRYSHNGHNCSETAGPNRISCFSPRGYEVNIAAPGGYPDIGDGYRDYSGGTSYSAPHVAGAIAILRAPDAAPGDTLAQTLGRLTDTGYDIASPGGFSTRMPRLDLMASLNSVFHTSVTQQFYVSLLGRPADPAGLSAFAQSLRSTGAPSTILDLNRLYDYSAHIRSLIDGVGSSAEVAALYPGDNGVFVTALYQNILNRSPDAGSLAHWRSRLDRGEMTRGRAALAIAATAVEYKEGATLYKRGAVANNFTKALDLPAEVAAYQRSTAEARVLLKSVDAVTDIDVMDAFIDSAIANMLKR